MTPEEEIAAEQAAAVWRKLSPKQRTTLRSGRFGETLRRPHKGTVEALARLRLIWQPGLLATRGEWCATGWGCFVAFEPEREHERTPGPSLPELMRRRGESP